MNRSFEKVSHEQYDDSAVDSFPEQQNLQDYLEARYTSNTTKKKKKKPPSTKTSLRIVDTDISGFTPIQETIEVVEAGQKYFKELLSTIFLQMRTLL